jgi:glycosyl transferase family 25
MWIFVINLDRDRDRLVRMISEAQRVGISFERFVAVDGKRLEDDLRDQFFSPEGPHEPSFTPGEIGCYASHLRIHRLLAEKDGECALVLEDDVRLDEDLVATLESAMARAPDWDIIRLSNAPKAVVLPVAPLPGGRDLVRYWTVPNGTGAYLISRSGAIKFTESYTRRTLPIDEDLRRPWRSGLNTYGVLPPPVEPDVIGFSQIDTMGRDRSVSARARFDAANRYRNLSGVFKHRLEVFGPVNFLRGLWRTCVVAAVKRLYGRKAAEKFYRL